MIRKAWLVQFFTSQLSSFGFMLSGENRTRHVFRIIHSLGFTVVPVYCCMRVRAVIWMLVCMYLYDSVGSDMDAGLYVPL